MDASIVISTYGREKDVVDCINSLLNLNRQNFEIVVIESSPDVLTAFNLKKRYKDHSLVRIIHSKIPIGLSRARNLGVFLAKNDIVVFIDDDCIACPNWLQNLLNGFKTKKTGNKTKIKSKVNEIDIRKKENLSIERKNLNLEVKIFSNFEPFFIS